MYVVGTCGASRANIGPTARPPFTLETPMFNSQQLVDTHIQNQENASTYHDKQVSDFQLYIAANFPEHDYICIGFVSKSRQELIFCAIADKIEEDPPEYCIDIDADPERGMTCVVVD